MAPTFPMVVVMVSRLGRSASCPTALVECDHFDCGCVVIARLTRPPPLPGLSTLECVASPQASATIAGPRRSSPFNHPPGLSSTALPCNRSNISSFLGSSTDGLRLPEKVPTVPLSAATVSCRNI